ncbi:MAG: HAD family phosphatase [Nanoarchaeota archaeon]
MKAVIFDMDGVLVDSIPVHTAIWAKLSEKYHFPFQPLSRFNGMKTMRICEEMGKITRDDPKTIFEEKQFLEAQFIVTVPFMDGAPELVHTLKGNFALGLGTSGYKIQIKRLDDRLHFLTWFSAVTTNEDVVNGKPAPDIFLKTAEKLGVAPKDCVVIEDAINGILAAKAAGMKCIALKNQYLDPASLKKADFAVSSLREITPALISKLLKT